MFGEALGAIAALQQEGFARLNLGERLLELARLAGEHQRREAGDLPLDVAERGEIRIDGRLLDRLLAPGVRGPEVGSHIHLQQITRVRGPRACGLIQCERLSRQAFGRDLGRSPALPCAQGSAAEPGPRTCGSRS